MRFEISKLSPQFQAFVGLVAGAGITFFAITVRNHGLEVPAPRPPISTNQSWRHLEQVNFPVEYLYGARPRPAKMDDEEIGTPTRKELEDRIHDGIADFDGLERSGEIIDLLKQKIGALKVVRMPSDIFDADLDVVAQCTGLQALSLAYSKVEGPGLAELEGLDRLHVLDLSDSRVDDKGVEFLPVSLPVRRLYLTGTRVTNEVVSILLGKHLDRLEVLGLSNTRIDDEAFKQLLGLPSLKELHVFHTGITDAALESIAQNGRLRFLSCGMTKVTSGGIAKLGSRCRELHIDYGG